MYRHIAEVIKETENKRFLSRADIDKYENQYPEKFVKRKDVHNKEEFDEIINELKTTYINIDGEVPSIKNTKLGFIQNLVIKGNTDHHVENLEIIPELESGIIDQSTGENKEVDNRLRTMDLIPVKCGDIVSFINDISNQENFANLCLYNSDKGFVEYVGFISSFEIPYNCAYVRYFHRSDCEVSKLSIKRTRLDIVKSVVGNDLGDGRYELKIVSCGKNIIGHEWEQGSIDGTTGVHTDSNHQHFNYRIRSKKFIPITTNCKHITYSTVLNSKYKAAIRFFDENKNFIHIGWLIGFIPDLEGKVIQIPENAKYFKIIIGDINAGGSNDNVKVNPDTITPEEIGCLFEYGTSVSEYEPYEECIKSIKLPCQLESIYNHRDKLFKREDGVWCIEKKILRYNGKMSEFFNADNHSYRVRLIDIIHTEHKPAWNKYSRYRFSIDNIFYPEVATFTDLRLDDVNKTFFVDNEGDCMNISNALYKSIDVNNSVFEYTYATTVPEIIELPLETQLVLNTFEGVTNIYSEGDIQPYISGLVPKTLTDEVYSLQYQLDEISETLTRLDTLQESNNVNYSSTNGDIYITDTNNGVANNISVKGKTLVNLLSRGFKDYDRGAYTKLAGKLLDDGYVKFTADNITYDLQAYRKLSETPLKTNTQYTLIVDILDCTITGTDNYHILYPVSNPPTEGYQNESAFKETWGLYARDCVPGSRHVKLITTKPSFNNVLYGMRSYVRYVEGISGYVSYRLMLLEGDHTENPPTYFEGIKSAGELSDTISIESRNESKNLFDINNFEIMNYYDGVPFIYSEMEGANSLSYNILGDTIEYTISCLHTPFYWNIGIGGCYKVKKNTKYNISFNSSYCSEDNTLTIRAIGIYEHERGRVLGKEYDIFQISSRVVSKTTNRGESNSITIDSKEYDYILVYIGGSWVPSPKTSLTVKLSGVSIIEEPNNKELTHESMSKKLIARTESGEYFEIESLKSTPYSSDTIEKHSDGKYYYHKRCEQLLFDGSADEGWFKETHEHENHYLFAINCKLDLPISVVKLINPIVCDKFKVTLVWHTDDEGVSYYGNADHNNNLKISVNKNRFTESDVNALSFRNYLSSNPVSIVFQLAEEEVYEVVNLNVNLYDGETNVYVKALPFAPELSLNANQYIGDVINDLQSRTKVLENMVMDQILSQNKILLSSMYSADKTNLKVNIVTMSTRDSISEIDYKIYRLLDGVISNGNGRFIYDTLEMEEIIDFYTMIGKITFEMAEKLLNKLYGE